MESIDTLKEIIGTGTALVIYGDPKGRIEEYTIDSYAMSGYDSSGSFRLTLLDALDLSLIQSISKLNKVYTKEN